MIRRILLLAFDFVFQSQFGFVVLVLLIGLEIIFGVLPTYKSNILMIKILTTAYTSFNLVVLVLNLMLIYKLEHLTQQIHDSK